MQCLEEQCYYKHRHILHGLIVELKLSSEMRLNKLERFLVVWRNFMKLSESLGVYKSSMST
jgi:hypothetical protein